MYERKKKTYTELYLESTLDKKRGIYFGDAQEEAIIQFNSLESSNEDKTKLFIKIIEPGFHNIISGVLEMKKFHKLPNGLSREDVIDSTFFRLVEKLNRFKPGMIGKSGMPVKAYSYYSTIAKNYILEIKVKQEKILKNKADVETNIDLSILSEDTLQKISSYEKNNSSFEDPITRFENSRLEIIKIITDTIKKEEQRDKPDKDLIKIGHCLAYMIRKWDKIEFMKKNEFMRILTIYTGLKQQQVSLLFKRYKIAILTKINPKVLELLSSSSDKDIDDIDEKDSEFEENFENEVLDIDEDIDDSNISNQEESDELEEEKLKYFTFEDYEDYLDKDQNKHFKKQWKEQNQKTRQLNSKL